MLIGGRRQRPAGIAEGRAPQAAVDAGSRGGVNHQGQAGLGSRQGEERADGHKQKRCSRCGQGRAHRRRSKG